MADDKQGASPASLAGEPAAASRTSFPIAPHRDAQIGRLPLEPAACIAPQEMQQKPHAAAKWQRAIQLAGDEAGRFPAVEDLAQASDSVHGRAARRQSPIGWQARVARDGFPE